MVATKQLLEILTAWSRREASEVNVSDVYVRLGYEFNIACRAFNGIGVETQDLGPVPDLLRNILEDTLSNEPSQASLEQYLPRIRDIIVNLLQGLKRKQQRLRQRNGRDAGPSSTSDSRQNSTSGTYTLPSLVDDRQNVQSSVPPRSQSGDVTAQHGALTAVRMSSAPIERASPVRTDSIPPQRAKSSSRSTLDYSIPASEAPKLPISIVTQEPSFIHPGPFSLEKSFPQPPETVDPSPTSFESMQPRPQPRQHDALAALQRGGELERRASRRFSAYQIQKHLGSNSSGIPMIPPSQHSPIPNRGRDPKDPTNTVRVRGSPLANSDRVLPGPSQTGSPVRQSTLRQAKSSDEPFAKTDFANSGAFDHDVLDSPMVKTPEDKLRGSYITSKEISQPNSSSNATPSTVIRPTTPVQPHVNSSIEQNLLENGLTAETFSAAAPTELTLFLQYKSNTKKFILADGYEELSMGRLQLAFIDKFAWNTHNNGLELPEIYIQDSVSGVRYELEDIVDVKNNSILSLNVDALEDIKRHVDGGMGSLKEMVEGIRSAVDDQKSALKVLAETQVDTAASIARLNAAPVQQSPPIPSGDITNLPKGTVDRLNEVQGIRRDLAGMRQAYTSLMSDMEVSMTGLRAKANTIKTTAFTASLPTFDNSSGRGYVDAGKKTLSDDSEKIINHVDDLQDVVEDLRKDVVSRGVRPLPRQLDTVSKQISTATAELKKLQEFIKREKPLWTKIWRNELEVVYDDQKNLNMQEELATDLEKDLTEAANTFALVEEATRQQNVGNTQNTPTRTVSRVLTPANVDVDPQKAKDGVLGEVRALQPNHETRLEAIERAEKARQKDLESRGEGAFKKELSGFVDEGRLKKSGGVPEAERLRKAKDDRIRKEVWDRTNLGGVVPPPEAQTLEVAIATPLPAPTDSGPTEQSEHTESKPTNEYTAQHPLDQTSEEAEAESLDDVEQSSDVD